MIVNVLRILDFSKLYAMYRCDSEHHTGGEMKIVWDDDAIPMLGVFGDGLVTEVVRILGSGRHVKIYPIQDGIGAPSLVVYNNKQDYALANVILTSTDAIGKLKKV